MQAVLNKKASVHRNSRAEVSGRMGCVFSHRYGALHTNEIIRIECVDVEI
jgi:hypothetical protein